jgi:hypothetical protein
LFFLKTCNGRSDGLVEIAFGTPEIVDVEGCIVS